MFGSVVQSPEIYSKVKEEEHDDEMSTWSYPQPSRVDGNGTYYEDDVEPAAHAFGCDIQAVRHGESAYIASPSPYGRHDNNDDDMSQYDEDYKDGGHAIFDPALRGLIPDAFTGNDSGIYL